MTRSLPDRPSMSLLRKQAKKLLKQVRDGNQLALSQVSSHHPRPGAFAGLRDAQLTLARSYGYSGWAELSDAVQLLQDMRQKLPEKAMLFIQLACVQYNANDTLRNFQRARRLLAASPEIADFSFHTALVANNARTVSDYLSSDPTLAVTPGGTLAWPPMFYVLYSRLGEPEGSRCSLSIVRQLLELGADPDTHIILDDTYRFTALTGAMGEGELGVNQPPHHHADEMVALLLDAGANPNEGQGLYNTMFTDSADKWLALLLSHGLTPKDPLNWNATGEDDKVTTLDYQLSCAVDRNRLARVKLLLDAGANPSACSTYNGRAIHTNALLAGHTAIAQVLIDHGAISEELDIQDMFALACVREDYATMTSLLDQHPTLTEDASLLHAAAEHASLLVVKALVEQGFDVDCQSKHGRTLLHHFALRNDTVAIGALLDLSARTDIRDRSYNGTAAGFAAYSAAYEAMHLLLDASDSLLEVVSCAYLERARSLVTGMPDAIHSRTEQGNTVLHVIGSWLHDEPEYDTCHSLIECLISAGADTNARNSQNQTPAQLHLANGADTVAELLQGYSS